MTFAVKLSGRFSSHVQCPIVKDRREIADRAVVSTVDHADIRGLVTASLSSVYEPVRTLGSRIAWQAGA